MSIVFMKVYVTNSNTGTVISVDRHLSSSLDKLSDAESNWYISRGR